MDWIEVTARTVDDAKELALDRLGVVEDELEFEVVDEARKGLFGIARGDARIRARVKPISREKPSDRKRRGRRPNERSQRGGQGGGGRGERGGGRGSGGQRGGRPDRPVGGAARPGDSDGAEVGDANDARDVSDLPARAPGQSGTRRRRGGRGRGSGGSARPAGERASGERSAGGRADDEKAEAEVDVETVPVENQAEHAAKFTEELVRTMGFSAVIRTEIDGDDVTVHIDGDGLGALVGPRGATIQALEEVVRAVVQHHAGGHSAWIHVDVAGYRERRRTALEEFARQVAAEVSETGEERALEPMGAADRKVVHDAISEVEGVDTTSEGEEPRRRVVVFPA